MEKENYRKSVLEYEDVQRAVAYAKELAFEDGVKKGREEGREEGRGALIRTAKNLLEMGLSIEQIIKATNLSKEEIESL